MQERYPDNSISFLLSTAGLLVILAGLLIAAWNGQTIIATALGIALATGALTKLWSRFCLSGVKCRRLLQNNRVFPGDSVTLDMQLSNRKLLPLPWVQVDDEIPLALLPGQSSSFDNRTGFGFLSKSAAVLWYSRVSWSTALPCPRRGYFPLGPMRITSGDIFGFHTRSKTETMEDHIIVYPKILPIEKLPLPAAYPQGNIRSEKRIFEDPLRTMGIRDYYRSDSIKKIHWKATARADKLQVKLLEPSTTTGAAIFFSVDNYLGENVTEADFEYGVSAAAGIARYIIEKGNAAGIYANTLSADTKSPIRVAPGTAPAHMKSILEALAKVTRFSSGGFDNFMDKERKLLTWGTALVIVLYEVYKPMESRFAHLRNAGYRLLIYETKAEKYLHSNRRNPATGAYTGAKTL